jgi:hypothetical protein
MKKLLLLVTSIFVLFLVIMYIKGCPMKLVHVKTGSIVVEFKGKETKFYDRILEQHMKMEGIVVPPFLQKDFEDKKRIRLDDPLFQRAFKEIHYPHSFDPTLYQWKKEAQ